MYSQDLPIKYLTRFIWKNRPEEIKTHVTTIVKNTTIRIDQGELMFKIPDLGIEISAGAIKKALGYLNDPVCTECGNVLSTHPELFNELCDTCLHK